MITDNSALPTIGLSWCVTCGNPVENDKCACWCMLADALQRFMGRDFDASAQEASELWDALSNEEKIFVWSGEYAETHEVETYQAPLEVREQDKLDHPHDEDCPRCGRRQWGGPDPYKTCQSCGFDYQ